MELRAAQEILEELLPSFEALETQTAAILQFLKEKGIATDQQLAPYLEKARDASNVRWRAARLRINRLLAQAFETAEESNQIRSAKSAATRGPEGNREPQKRAATAVREGERNKQDGRRPARSTAPKPSSAQSIPGNRRRA